MSDYALAVRRAVLPALKASPLITDLIPAAQIYPGTVPAGRQFPFFRYTTRSMQPFRATCLDSSSGSIMLQGFMKPTIDSDGVFLVTAEDNAYRIGAAFKDVIDDATLVLEGGMKARFSWFNTIVIQDRDESDCWYATGIYRVEVSG